MSCKPFKTSEANAKSYLKTKGVIDDFLNVKDLGKFRTEHSKLRQQAKEKYFSNVEGWDEKLFLENKEGTKVYPNTKVFKEIDKISAIREAIDEKETFKKFEREARLTQIEDAKRAGIEYDEDYLFQKNSNFQSSVYSKEVKQALLNVNFNQNISTLDIDKLPINSKAKQYLKFTLDKNKNIKTYSDLINTVYNDKFKNEYYSLFTQEVNPKLEKKLIDFLKQFHFDIEETTLNKLKQEFGLNILGVTDIINKTIKVVSKDERNILTLPEEIAHAVFELLGSNYSNSKIGHELLKTVSGWEGYKTIYNEYSNIYKDAEGNVDWKKVQKEAIGKALAMAMINYNSQSFIKLPTDVKILLEKIVNLIRQLLGLSYKDAIKLEKNIKFKDLINEIAGNVLNNNLDYFKTYNDKGFTTTDYLETIQEQNKEDGGKAVKLMQLISKNNGAITGSLSLRKVSQLKRSKEGLLHDIDTYFNSQDLFGLPITRKLTQEEFENTELFSDLQNEYGESLHYFTNWFHNIENYNALHYYITSPEIDKKIKTGKEKGLRLSDIYETLSLEEQKETILIDFFIEPKQVKVIHDDVYNINLTTPEYSYLPKLFVMGRNKDVYDYQNLKYFDNKFKIDDDRNYMFQLSQDESFEPKEESDVDEFVDDEFNFDDLVSEHGLDEKTNPAFDLESEMETPISNVETLVKYKKSLISKIKDRIANLQLLAKSAESRESAIAYARKENELQKRLIQLEDDIIASESGLSFAELAQQAKIDLERLQVLLSSDNVNDLNEAKRVINFYKAMSFNPKKLTVDNRVIDKHPIFFEEEIFDENGKMILPQQTVDFFENVSKAFTEQEKILELQQKKAIENIFNSNPKVQELYKQVKYNDLTSNLSDISYVDMFIMDISKNTFSSNGLIPQMMMEMTQAVFAEKISHTKRFEEKHNAALLKAQKALKQLGYGLGLSNNVSFELFFQKALGRNTGRLVNRYAQKFFDSRAEMLSDFSERIRLIKAAQLDEKSSNALFKETYDRKQKWFRENTIVFNIRSLKEIQDAFPDLSEYFDEVDDNHRKELIENLGSEQAYKEEVEKQIKQIRKYFLWKEAYLETVASENGVDTFEDITDPQVRLATELNLIANSPFSGSDYFHNTSEIEHEGIKLNTSMEYNISVPRRFKGVVTEVDGKYVVENSSESTSYYDEQFSKIEKNKDLYEYYKIVQEELSHIINSFPADVQDKLFVNSLTTMRKSYSEILADPNTPLFKKLWNALVDLLEKIKLGFGVSEQSTILYDDIDVISGQTENKINDSFITGDKQRVNQLFEIELKKINNLIKDSGSKVTVKKNNTINLYALPFNVVKELTEKLKIQPSYEALKAKYGDRIPVGNILYQSVMADLVEDSSTDLPKIIKYMSLMAAEYNARQELLPYMEMMKQHYTQIKKPMTNKQKKPITNFFTQSDPGDGLRVRANTQMEDWFNRIILGQDTSKDTGVVNDEEIDIEATKNNLKAAITGRVLSREDKKLKKELDALIEKETNEVELEKLIKMRNKLGRKITASATVDNFLNYIRFLGLGWNLSSAITNYAEGQIANMIIAATGDHFESHHYYRALNIVKGSFFKNFTGESQFTSKDAKKLRKLMDKFNILQDSTNELQKASVKTSLNQLEKFSPMELNKRTEYLNQAPLALSVLFNTKIKSKDGKKEVNPWDAMDENLNLLPEFRTEENIKAWEQNQGETFTQYKSKVGQAIGMAHGMGYDNLRGMLAKKSIAGRVIMMFKTWVGSQLYTRFAAQRDDLELGIKGYKGRYRSFTKTSGALMGAVIGFGTGGIGFAVGAAITGGVIANYAGVKSNLGALGELTFLAKAIARKMIGMPINFVGSTFTGKQVMNEFVGYEKLLKNGKFTERDMKNMKALVTEMSLMLTWILLAMLAKSMFWDDDDEEDSPERIAHNLLVNRSLQLLGSASSFLQPWESYKSLVGEVGFFRWLKDMAQLQYDLSEWAEGNDIITSGVNKGESRSANSFYKIALPSIVKDSAFGFSTQMEKQFKKTNYDDWYFDDTKKANKIIQIKRTQYRAELEQIYKDLPEKVKEKRITKLLNKKYPLLKDIKDPESKE